MYKKIFILYLTIQSLFSIVLFGQHQHDEGHVHDSGFEFIKGQVSTVEMDQKRVIVEKSAIEWAKLFLAAEYAPPENARYIFLEGDDQNVDRLRLAYSIENFHITITQTKCVFGLQVHRIRSDKSLLTEEELLILTKRLFKESGSLVLKTTNKTSKLMEGHCLITDQNDGPWLYGAFWWQNNTSFGYYFVKLDRHPSSAVIGYDYVLNSNWFK